MKTLKFKRGEYCYCEFVLQKVTKTEKNRITRVSDGLTIMGGYDLSDKCYPNEAKVKEISEMVKSQMILINKIPNCGLNIPDLHREFVKRWIEMCENINDKNRLNELSIKFLAFNNEIFNEVNKLFSVQVEGIFLFDTSYSPKSKSFKELFEQFGFAIQKYDFTSD